MQEIRPPQSVSSLLDFSHVNYAFVPQILSHVHFHWHFEISIVVSLRKQNHHYARRSSRVRIQNAHYNFSTMSDDCVIVAVHHSHRTVLFVSSPEIPKRTIRSSVDPLYARLRLNLNDFNDFNDCSLLFFCARTRSTGGKRSFGSVLRCASHPWSPFYSAVAGKFRVGTRFSPRGQTTRS